MKEVELKLRYDRAEREKLAERLRDEGFKACGAENQEDRYLTPKHRNIFMEDEALRVRRSGNASWSLNYKGKNTGGKLHERPELETAVGDGETLLAILKGLDFTELITVRKSRTVFTKGHITVCVDEVEGLGDFIEVEVMAEDGEATRARETIETVAKSMTLETAVPEPKNYPRLLLEKQ